MKSKSLSLTLALIGAAACSSNKAEKMDTTLEKSTDVRGDTRVGVRGGDVVVQRKVYLAEELRKLEGEVYALEDEVYGNERYGTVGLTGAHKECSKKLADPRLGGSGKLQPKDFGPRVTRDEEDLKFIIDEKEQLMGITEEALRDRINRFRGYRKLLGERKDEVRTALEVCENDYDTALINHGLNPQDKKPEGEWVMGPAGYRVWKAKKKPTVDPEELNRRKAVRQKKEQTSASEDGSM